MKKETFKLIRKYYNSNLQIGMPKEQFKTNMCGFLNALYFMDMIDSNDYCKVINHIKKGTKLTAKAMK
jgi:hypothetical protein